MSNPLPGANGQPGTPAPMSDSEQTYSGSSDQVKVAGSTADLVHPAPAHTDGDTIVLWPAENVISTGDIVASASYPNIDVAVGGGIDGMIAGANYVIDHSNAKTKIVPGHGPVTDRAGVKAYRSMLQTARDRIAKAKAIGQTEDQVATGICWPSWMANGSRRAARPPGFRGWCISPSGIIAAIRRRRQRSRAKKPEKSGENQGLMNAWASWAPCFSQPDTRLGVSPSKYMY